MRWTRRAVAKLLRDVGCAAGRCRFAVVRSYRSDRTIGVAVIGKRYLAVSLRTSVSQVALGGVFITTVGLVLGAA
jgi:hypothetical protein